MDKHTNKVMEIEREFKDALQQLIEGKERHPYRVLGIHRTQNGNSVLFCMIKGDSSPQLKFNSRTVRMERIFGCLYSAFLGDEEIDLATIRIVVQEGNSTSEFYPPYIIGYGLSRDDIYLFKKGELFMAYRTFGAIRMKIEGIEGTRFTVWAPRARSVSVIGDFNGWDRTIHPMENVDESGIWNVFVPGDHSGLIYKYSILTEGGDLLEKTDPFAFHTEMRPKTGAIIFQSNYVWNDGEWRKKNANYSISDNPVSVYEIHIGSWIRNSDGTFRSYREIANKICEYVKPLGFTHVEILPVMEHPLDESWGYQVINYFAPSARYGDPDGFRNFIDTLHVNGLGVILDWVPAHFPSDSYGLYRYDGYPEFEYSDPLKERHPDWGTSVFDFGRPEVMSFLISSAIYWVDEFHADGIRIDAVSSMLYLDYSRKEGEWRPNVFGGRENLEAIALIRKLNCAMKKFFPWVMMIAEESTAWPGVTRSAEDGGLGFDMKWNMGWMHDTLFYFSEDPLYRKYHQNSLTFSMWYAFNERFILPLSHDEVVHGKGSLYRKMPGDHSLKMANLRCLFSYQYLFPGKKLNFMGNEFGQDEEWNHSFQLSWHETTDILRKGLTVMIMDLNALYRGRKPLHQTDFTPSGFRWIDYSDSDQSIISFIRRTSDAREYLVCVFNFTPMDRNEYRIGVPDQGTYRVVFNSSNPVYGGNGVTPETVSSEAVPMHGFGQSVELKLPGLTCLVLEHMHSVELER